MTLPRLYSENNLHTPTNNITPAGYTPTTHNQGEDLRSTPSGVPYSEGDLQGIIYERHSDYLLDGENIKYHPNMLAGIDDAAGKSIHRVANDKHVDENISDERNNCCSLCWSPQLNGAAVLRGSQCREMGGLKQDILETTDTAAGDRGGGSRRERDRVLLHLGVAGGGGGSRRGLGMTEPVGGTDCSQVDLVEYKAFGPCSRKFINYLRLLEWS